jgi:hypothetical protein
MRGWRNSIASVFPPEHLLADGHAPITVASRFGSLMLSRQVLFHRDTQVHVMPGNAVLPAHNGMIITRGLQEWACLLPQKLPFASVARLLGWQTLDDVLSESTVRSLVRRHGQIIRQAEQTEATVLATRDDLATLDLNLVPHAQPRRRAGWPAELNAAVDAALAREQIRRPNGVSWADWERGKGRPACRGARLHRGPAPPRAGTGAAPGAPHGRRSVGAPTRTGARSLTAHGPARDRARLSLLERCGHGVPAVLAGRRVPVSGPLGSLLLIAAGARPAGFSVHAKG